MIQGVNNQFFDINIFRDVEPRSRDTSFPQEAEYQDNQKISQQSEELEARDSSRTHATEEGQDLKNKDQNNSSDKVGPKDSNELSEEEKREVQELKETDRKVRQHEMAHLAAAQGIAVSGANFQYKRGPDGINYAVGGDVKIDVSKEKDPKATIDKARRIAAAATAPADPSPQDRQVASRARQMEAQASMELAKEQMGNTQEDQSPSESNIDSQINNNPSSKPHYGIKIYNQNQAFAPNSNNATKPPNPNQLTDISTNNEINPNHRASPSSFRLDMVA